MIFFSLTVINVCVYKCPVNWRPIIKKISENLWFFFNVNKYFYFLFFLKDGTHSSLPLVFSPAQVYFVYFEKKIVWGPQIQNSSLTYCLLIWCRPQGLWKFWLYSNTLKLAHTKLCVCICSSQKDRKIWVLNSL